MMTDAEGFNSFFHVLIFYEEINEAEISANDFDIVTEILRKQHISKQYTQKISNLNRESSKDGVLFTQYKKKLADF